MTTLPKHGRSWIRELSRNDWKKFWAAEQSQQKNTWTTKLGLLKEGAFLPISRTSGSFNQWSLNLSMLAEESEERQFSEKLLTNRSIRVNLCRHKYRKPTKSHQGHGDYRWGQHHGLYALWTKTAINQRLLCNWVNRDRFVLSLWTWFRRYYNLLHVWFTMWPLRI